jgi:hydroxycarboxylate dehydrogenase B
VMVASMGGKAIPSDALIGPDGRVSDDAHLLYGDYEATGKRDARSGKGAIRAFGEHKGSGLALMCELLGGALSGNRCVSPGQRFANGMFSFYVDPVRVDPGEMFPAEAVRYVDFVKSGKPAAAGGETLLPGEPEARTRAQRLQQGVPVPDETWNLILETARSVGVDTGRVQSQVGGHR